MSLPEILKVKPMNTVDSMSIHTSILEPIVCNQNVCRFTLERRGILDINSAVQVGAVFQKDAGDAAIKHFPPIRTGGHALIKTATLRIGATAIATTDEYGHYQTMMRQFKAVEERCRKDGVLSGCVDGLEPSNLEDGGLQPMNLGWGRNTFGHPEVNAIMSETNEIVSTDTTAGSPEAVTAVFAVKLSELFPMMRSVQLPLYLIQEPVSIEIQWAEKDEGVSYIREHPGGGASSTSGLKIATTQVKFLADYLTYSDDRMAEMGAQVMSEDGLQMPYNDIILTSTATSQTAHPGAGGPPVRTDVNREIGLSSRVVKSIMWSDRVLAPADAREQLLGVYRSDAYCQPDQFNLRINDRLMFNRPVENEAQKNNYLAQVEGVELQVTSAEYSLDQNVEHNTVTKEITLPSFSAAQTVEQIPISQQTLGGHAHYCGVDLITNPLVGSGTLIGQKPVTLERTIFRGLGDENAKARETLIWSKVERQFVLKSGVVSVTE